MFAWGALAAVCGLGWLLLPRLLSSTPSPPAVPAWHLLVEAVDTATTDSSGRLYRRLRADELRRAAPDAKSELIRPRLTLLPETGKIWRFTAERGEVSPDRENVYLSGPVHGRRGPARPLEVESRDVRIMVSKSYGESDGPSTIRGTGFETRGTGVRFWLEEDRVELLSDAHGVFRPQ